LLIADSTCHVRVGFLKTGMGKTPYSLGNIFQLIVGVMRGKNTSQTREQAGGSSPCQAPQPHRILVVEDEPDLRLLNAEVLKTSGYKVDTAEDGKAGWKVLHAVRHAPESYDLLITDHEMPGLTGLALVQKVRAASMTLPVIMATGRLVQPISLAPTRSHAAQTLFRRAVVGNGGSCSPHSQW
jgi:CheY-like chemotaxis protein